MSENTRSVAVSATDNSDVAGETKEQENPLFILIKMIFSRSRPVSEEQSFNWRQDVHRAYFEQRRLRASSLLYGVVIVVLVLLVWSAFAELDEVTKGEGRVIPSRQIQIVQSQDGGMVTEILVGEGDIVNIGQLLIKLDQTRSTSSLRENQAEFQALEAKAQRLRAIADGNDYTPEQALIDKVPLIVAQERALFESSKLRLENEKEIARQQLTQRRKEYEEAAAHKKQLRRSLALANRELSVTRPMVFSGAVSEVELLRLEREVNQLSGENEQVRAQQARLKSAIEEAQGKLQEVELNFISQVREELTSAITRMNGLKESGLGLSDRVAQTAVRSPVRGTVKQLFYNTIGGVVLPGKEVIEIVPLDDTLLLEARIQPKDIAFLTHKQKAMVKFTAYDFIVYGGLEGVVEQIGADTVMDEKGNPFYTVKVRTHESSLGEDKPIIPGMVVQVDILTGKKSILSYLFKPILRAKQNALTER
ncbi:MAG: adhesin transport system membrane fusion protein [Paraglaciecola psychrophila]|jgi:adhesin transport system membrane fusion protein